MKLSAENHLSNRTQRNIGLDVARIFAVLSVIMIHISMDFVVSDDLSSQAFIWGNIFDSISQIAVPLFLMISGALMLDERRNISTRIIFTKYIKNILLLLVFWSAVYSGVYSVIVPLRNGRPINFHNILYTTAMGHYHMWYLYMIIGLYLFTPFLRMFAREQTKHLVLLFIGISVLFQFVVPVLQALRVYIDKVDYLLKIIPKFHTGMFQCFAAYYLLGWYVTNTQIQKKWIFYIAGAAALLATIVYVQLTGEHDIGYSNASPLKLIYALGVFVALDSLKHWQPPEGIRKLITTLSNLSFGVYIVHVLCISVIKKLIPSFGIPGIDMICAFFAVAVMSFTLCFIASKIPVIKKAVRM